MMKLVLALVALVAMMMTGTAMTEREFSKIHEQEITDAGLDMTTGFIFITGADTQITYTETAFDAHEIQHHIDAVDAIAHEIITEFGVEKVTIHALIGSTFMDRTIA